ncbi:prostaglandin E2 receptor EP4 subtype-like [Pomacea canaliculata]|uniref:prostaglandin E2 receptor EP4 subtype-like n=1 Tax=Pomacea canaliculata TaxID=400727 RepID=UPI000D72AF04|nr:prostaglandin E2 receptor EP4 subtype-like [Pomacea canaliculata]
MAATAETPHFYLANPAYTEMGSKSEARSSPDFTYPAYHTDSGVVFNVLYYGVVIPVSYVGNLFTYIIVCKMLRYRDSTADVLVGGLALNDVLTAVIVFTPALISAVRGRYFGSRVMCEFSAVTTTWYIYTTFAILVLINVERWVAITKPFFYKRLGVTSSKLKFLIAMEGLFCLLLASMPLFRYPVTLKAGWYCALVSPRYVTSVLFVHTNDTVNNTFVDRNDLTIEYNDSAQETLAIKGTFLLFGIALLVACNASIAFELHKRPFRDAASREMDRKFACIMGVVAVLFLLTWFPNLAAHVACLHQSQVCAEFEFWAMRIVNVGVAVNPFVYGVMKTTYRRGYLYLARITLHYISCTLIPKPPYGEEIFDMRQRIGLDGAQSRSSSTRQRQDDITERLKINNDDSSSSSTQQPSGAPLHESRQTPPPGTTCSPPRQSPPSCVTRSARNLPHELCHV